MPTRMRSNAISRAVPGFEPGISARSKFALFQSSATCCYVLPQDSWQGHARCSAKRRAPHRLLGMIKYAIICRDNHPMPLHPFFCPIRYSVPALVAVFIGILAGASFSTIASASPRLRCHLIQGDTAQVQDFAPVLDPYSVKAVDLNGSFRFKAVVIGDERKIDYIKLYAYYQSKRQAVLLHVAKYLAPVVDAAAGSAALTGTNTFYSPDLGREFQYRCALIEVTP